MDSVTIGSPALWIGFSAMVLFLLALDLGVFHRKAHAVRFKEALTWSIVWVGLALLFNLGIWHYFGEERGLEFLTGYLIEKALSVDNIFVFVLIFGAFAVPEEYQHRVLFWGVLGALVMRAIFIVAGAALLESFHFVIYIFGGFLLLTAVKMLKSGLERVDPRNNPVFRLFRRAVPAVDGYHGSRFFIHQAGKLFATPLLLVLVAVELTDLVFAVDSIPAIFAVTRDPFIVFTSNIFAILGLRALYFLLAGVVEKFHHLKTGLALVLAFVGVKMLIVDLVKIPIGLSLGVIALLLVGSVLASLLFPKRIPPVVQPAPVPVTGPDTAPGQSGRP